MLSPGVDSDVKKVFEQAYVFILTVEEDFIALFRKNYLFQVRPRRNCQFLAAAETYLILLVSLDLYLAAVFFSITPFWAVLSITE